MYRIQESSHNSEMIWQNFGNRIRTFILSKVRDEAVADDLCQEVFIKIHQHIGSLNDSDKLQSWIFRIARNCILDYYRKSSNSGKTSFTDEHPIDEPLADDLTSEATNDLISMLKHLPPIYCDALCQTELGNLSQKEFAEREGISYSAAKSRIQRARKMLQDLLMQCCHYQFDKYGTVLDIRPNRCCCCQLKVPQKK